jgi:hypothetical protein
MKTKHMSSRDHYLFTRFWPSVSTTFSVLFPLVLLRLFGSGLSTLDCSFRKTLRHRTLVFGWPWSFWSWRSSLGKCLLLNSAWSEQLQNISSVWLSDLVGNDFVNLSPDGFLLRWLSVVSLDKKY